MAKRSLFFRIAVRIFGFVALVAVCLIGACVVFSKPLPDGVAGPEADALARTIEQAVRKDAWDRTEAVRWTFAGRNQHLWDRKRMYARVRFGDVEAQVDLTTKTGVALRKGVPVAGEAGDKLVQKAYAAWINDSFWLNPLAKFFDDGVTRKLITRPTGEKDLLISYSSGGLTPGDSYLWSTDGANRPIEMRMWVSIIPLKGIRVSWENWLGLSTNAQISTLHKFLFVTLKLTDVAGSSTLAELEPGADPFAALTAKGAAR